MSHQEDFDVHCEYDDEEYHHPPLDHVGYPAVVMDCPGFQKGEYDQGGDDTVEHAKEEGF